MHTSTSIAALTLLVVAAVACGGTAAIDTPEVGVVASPNCPMGPFGGPMVDVDTGAHDTYCIDATEVTRGAYQRWLETSPTVRGGQIADDPSVVLDCGNVGEIATAPTDSQWPPGGEFQLPVVVQWCEAYTFCQDNGKRLCGQLGGDMLFLENTLASKDGYPLYSSEWYVACTDGGSWPYAYGEEYEAANCIDPAASPGAVAAMPRCTGGVAGLFDMTGNVREWTAACERACPDPSTRCEVGAAAGSVRNSVYGGSLIQFTLGFFPRSEWRID